MSRPINYNDWFYKYHKYVKGNRDGLITYNDTKWKNINDRLLPLTKMQSSLIDEQPYAVVGNNYGVDKLLNLMQDSNYTFNDINDALVDAYCINYKNAMSKMVVNTHAVICSFTNKDSKNVRYDSLSNYYIIDVPYDQMHFGERDEFIRQRLQQMHVKSTDVWIHINDLNTIPIYKEILEFSIMITMNGYICNDIMVAFDDKGMMFKARWKHSTNFECIVYKLDTSNVYTFDIPTNKLTGSNINIAWKDVGDKHERENVTTRGIVDMYYPEFTSSMTVPGNICYIDSLGIHIPNIQNATSEMITTTGLSSIRFVVYELKYFFEIPNVYPAMNYYDMMERNRVKYNNDNIGVDGDSVYAKHTTIDYTVHISTPPIVIDRDSSRSYQTMLDMLTNETTMKSYIGTIVSIGNMLKMINDSTSQIEIDNTIVRPLEQMYPTMLSCRSTYLKFATLTTMVDQSMINLFDKICNDVKTLYDVRNDRAMLKQTQPDMFFGSAYKDSVERIYNVLNNEMFSTMRSFNVITQNFVTPEPATRFNRPVSEQCFITMRYDADSDVWLFCNPKIKHFNGIQNAFYINSGITGKEIFKFFVLYTDTESTSEKYIEPMTESQIFDFDIFCDEMMKYQSYVRYWSVENKLMKLSDIMFNEYDGTTCVNVMSKMLKHKIGNDLVSVYPSDINYEASGISTLGDAVEDTLESPFTINYLFYTLNQFYNKDDMFLSYFLYRLTHNNYSERYIDIDISDVLNTNNAYDVNYSYFWTAPDTILTSTSALRDGDNVYQTLPFVVNGNGSISNNPYRYIFNECGSKAYLIENNEINEMFYLDYIDPTYQHAFKNIYHNDIEVARLLTHYMSMVHDYMSSIMTDYQHSFNMTKLLTTFEQRIHTTATNMTPYVSESVEYSHQDTFNLVKRLFGENYTTTNMIYTSIDDIILKLKSMLIVNMNGRNISLYTFIQDFNGLLKRIYHNYGYKDYATPRARKLYMHLKKINLTMNLYEFGGWLSNIDILFINNIRNYVGNNTLYPDIDFTQYINIFNYIYDNAITWINGLSDAFTYLNNQYNIQINDIRRFVFDIVNNYIFDMYRMNVSFKSNTVYDNKPLYAKITLPTSAHITHPVTSQTTNNVELILYPKYQLKETKYEIISLIPICEYAFFDDTPIDDIDVDIITTNGTVQTKVNLTFIRVGSSADDIDTFKLINSLYDTKVDVQNVHETFQVVNNRIIDSKYTDMHYELLIGNKFAQLSHTPELILDRNTKLPGSIDRIYANNEMINSFAIESYGGHHTHSMYFKPSQIMHLPINDNVIESVYGPFAVGQKIYLETADNEYRFPATITTIDHSQSRGFLEAIVDKDSEWFEINDITKIEDYLFNEIECHVIPDNVSNFLNEYNNPNTESYNIIDLNDLGYEEQYRFPGDPIFVQNNANYVYSRLNWIIDDNIDNRFIDDEHKQYQFKYIGEYQMYDADVPMMPVCDGVDNYYDSLRYLTDSEWLNINNENPLKLTINSIGSEHEVRMSIHGTHRDTNVIKMTGPDVEYSMDNRTIYMVFKRVDGVPLPIDPEHGYALPSSILGTSISTDPNDPVFMIGVYNQDDTNFDKLMFYGGCSEPSNAWEHSIISDVDATEYHVVCLTNVHDETADTRYVSMYIDGVKIGTLEHNYPFINWLGLGQLVTSGYGEQYVIFGDTGTLCVKFISTVNGVHTDEEIVENSDWLHERYIDPTTMQTHPIYDSFRVNMINHNINPLTLSEMYPILRTEPDDHDIWDGEIAVFESRIEVANVNIERYERLKEQYTRDMEAATTRYDKDYFYRKIEDCDQKMLYWNRYIERMKYHIRNLENPTTWYNVGSYNTALVYINNGKAKCVSNSFVECVTDIPYTDELELYMYDYQNHEWIQPSDYTVTTNIVDGVRFDNPDDFATNNVLHSIDVELLTAHVTQKLLVYIGFKKSDMFTDIPHNTNVCNVRFKPLLSINRNIDNDIYSDINVRKHFDGYEYYKYTEDNLPNDIDRADILEGFMVERPEKNGKYTANPVYRFRDIMINNKPYSAFDFYVPIAFPDIDTTESSDVNTYSCVVNVPVDSYQPNTKMTLICVESDKYNGNVSSLSFEALSGPDDAQSFTITKSSILHIASGSYICTVANSLSAYKSCGGLVTVNVTKTEKDELKCGNWVKLNDPKYHIIPNKFIVVCPSEGGFPYNVIIKNTYYNDQGKWLNPDNSQEDDPYQYYYDTNKHVRYPISDTRHSDHLTRLAINTNTNPNIELIKAPYIGICRYSLNVIPENGIINMSGYLPTPLTRDRYEFWVNGRCISDDKSLHILSPTSIQLCNLNSLRNFECIELVDDMDRSDVLPQGNVYIDLYGNYYHTNDYLSFMQMMLNNSHIIEQRIDYMFYNLQHDSIYENTDHIITNPNNHDDEPNILDTLILNETNDYRQMIHLPTINGVTLYNLSIKDLGIHELDNKQILKMYDKVWRHEAITNPYIPLHHKSDILNIPIIKYTKDETEDCYRITVAGQYDGFFTIYISSAEDGGIDDTSNTIQIIPIVNCGIEITLSGIEKYKKKYVHTTTYSTPVKLN